ncbi:hypothetical protein D3C72_2270700 [compost metagenome]
MPGRSRRQLVLFQKHAVGPAGLGKMVERGSADRPPTDDHDPRVRRQIRHALFPRFAGILAGETGRHQAMETGFIDR